MATLARGRQRGFTLVEILIVVAILAVLAAVVFPTVTGTTSRTRQTSQNTDINEVQTAVDRFNADDTDGKAWPTDASPAEATSTAWLAGQLPTGTGPGGSGTSGDPYVFTQNDIAGINWTSPATVDGVSKTFVPDYLRSNPDHTDETIAVSGGSTSSTFKIKKGGEDVYVKLENTATSSVTFDVWGLDKNGAVWIFVNAEDY